MITTGDTFIYPFSFSQTDVERFADVTGDNNPIHLDEAYAKNTIFKKPIIHGFLGGSIFSKVFGTLFPGEGSLYLKQSMEFRKPMYVDMPYEAVFTVTEVNPARHRAIVKTEIIDKTTNVVILTGEATIMHPSKI